MIPDSKDIFPESINLKNYTTFRIGGPCHKFYDCSTENDLIHVLKGLEDTKKTYFLLGGGSNLVVSDSGVDIPVVRYWSRFPVLEIQDGVMNVSAASRIDDAVAFAAERGWSGLNYASGIPGTIGGAVVGNAGAFGQQVGDHLISARAWIPGQGIQNLSPADFGFAYRHSLLKDSGWILLSVTFRMSPDSSKKLQEERGEILDLRRKKHPDWSLTPCAGSFFRNIEPTSKAGKRQAAGFYLEQSGTKNLRVGGATCYPKHANIIIKSSQECTALDVYELHKLMAEAVWEKFQIRLKREVRFVGSFPENTRSEKIIW